MINHISIAAHEPEKVARVLAELWDGDVIPFPPCPNSFMALANDGRGTAVEVTPANTVLVPGEGFPAEENFDQTTPTEEFEAKFVAADSAPRYVATHLNINTNLSEAEVKAIGDREGWRVVTCNRGGGLFQLIELWVEDRFMLEVMTPEQTGRYIEITKPELFAEMPGITFPKPTESLNLTG